MAARKLRQAMNEFPPEFLSIKSGRTYYRRLMKMKLLQTLLEPHQDPPTYNHAWWEETFPTLPDGQMISLYRMSRSTFDEVLAAIRGVAPESHHEDLPRKLATTLHYLADPTSFRRQGHLHGCPKSTLGDWIPLVCSWVVHALGDRIRFPRTEDGTAQAVAERIQGSSGFPGVVGFVDSSLIPLSQRPNDQDAEDGNVFWTRKGRPAYHLQGTCDDRLLFIDVWIGNADRMHDSRVWMGSNLRRHLPRLLQNRKFHILGDKAYPLSPYLLPPYKGNVRGDMKRFNSAHASIRQCIERAFGLLKSRWRIFREMPLTPPRWAVVTHACCILHNVCTIANEPIDEEDDPDLGGDGEDGGDQGANNMNDDLNYAVQKRNAIARFL